MYLTFFLQKIQKRKRTQKKKFAFTAHMYRIQQAHLKQNQNE